jgi:hypothetical protein
MNSRRIAIPVLLSTLLIGVAGCGDRNPSSSAGAGPKQTGFPGQVTAGGGTSGEVLARAGRATEGTYIGGTPGIAGGAEGNVGGPATGGTVQESGKGPVGSLSSPAGNQTSSQSSPTR